MAGREARVWRGMARRREGHHHLLEQRDAQQQHVVEVDHVALPQRRLMVGDDAEVVCGEVVCEASCAVRGVRCAVVCTW